MHIITKWMLLASCVSLNYAGLKHLPLYSWENGLQRINLIASNILLNTSRNEVSLCLLFFWEYHTIYLNHTCSLLPPISTRSSPSSISNLLFVTYFSLSTIYAPQNFWVHGLCLEYDWLSKVNTVTENWLSLLQKLSITNRYCLRGGTSSSLFECSYWNSV